MDTIYNRTKLLVGQEGIDRLKNARVAVLGIGGVGSFTTEALARAGVGHLTLIDHDTVDITNLNRQIHALRDTVGLPKVEVMKERIAQINPEIDVVAKQEFITPNNVEELLNHDFDYIVDAVDNVTAKLSVIQYAVNNDIEIISSMGTANKLDNTSFQIVDISKTHTCPLAKVMRKELRDRGINKGVQVVYSTAPAMKPDKYALEKDDNRRQTPGSISYVPSTAGLIIGGVVIQKLLNI